MISNIESSFLWPAFFKPHRNHSKGFGVERPMWSDNRSLSRGLTTVKSGSKRMVTKTRLRSPDRILTIWSRPRQETTCATIAPSGKRPFMDANS